MSAATWPGICTAACPKCWAAMQCGRLDQPRGQVFSTWTQGLSAEHTDAVLVELLVKAPELTSG